MAGDISVINRPKARMTPTWDGVMRSSSLICCAVRASLSRIHDPCFQTRPGCCAWSPILTACATGFGGGAGSNATAIWAAKLGMNLQSSTLKNDETGEAFHVQQAAQIRAYRAAWRQAMLASRGSQSAAASSH